MITFYAFSLTARCSGNGQRRHPSLLIHFLVNLLTRYSFGSGFGFPVPLSKIPENIYLNARYIYTILKGPIIAPKRAELQKRGFKADLDFLGLPGPDVPWITVDIEGASVPMDVLHPNVTIAGPIFISSAPASEQDPELAAWLERAPTVLVNLGSLIVVGHMTFPDFCTGLTVSTTK